MDGGYDTGAEPGVRVLRHIVPWAVLAAIVLAVLIIWSGFNASLRQVSPAGQMNGSVVATPSAEASVTSVPTSTIAVTRVSGVKVLSSPGAGAKVLMTLKKGTKLDVLERSDAWLRVREPDGLVGWIANSSKTVTIRKK
jgi:hypothetical protein